MNNTEKHSNELKEKILTDPNIILEDSDLMDALINAQNRLYGDNIVDLRGAAMSQLEKRLEKVESNHNDVIALAYENLSGASQIQRAILRLLETNYFPSFIKILSKEFKDILNIEHVSLILETNAANENITLLKSLNPVTILVAENTIKEYLAITGHSISQHVALRTNIYLLHKFYENNSHKILSEALLNLNFDNSNVSGLLILGSKNKAKFAAGQGTELLTFFAQVFERIIARWLT